MTLISSANEVDVGTRVEDSNKPFPISERYHLLSIKADNAVTSGKIEFYFKTRPQNPDCSNDNPLMLRIPYDCLVIIDLDQYWNWQFRADAPTIKLGVPASSGVPKPENRYYNLRTVPDANGRLSRAMFYADKLPEAARGNKDSINIYINFDQILPSGQPPSFVPIKIDPDMQNPGDPPPHLPTTG